MIGGSHVKKRPHIGIRACVEPAFRRPGPAPRDPAPRIPAAGRTPGQTRRRVRLRRPRHLGSRGRDHDHRHPPLRKGPHPGLGPAAPPPDPSRRLGRTPRPATDHHRHRHPAHRRAPPEPGRAETGLAVVVQDRRHARRCRPLLADVLAQVRHRAHLQNDQADPRVDRPAPAGLGRGRPVDLADPGRAHPAASGPAARRGPAPAVGTPGSAAAADPGPGPAGVSEPPHGQRLASACTETQ